VDLHDQKKDFHVLSVSAYVVSCGETEMDGDAESTGEVASTTIVSFSCFGGDIVVAGYSRVNTV
jgi:hypothetical protein